MSMLLSLAFRNLTRNLRRTLLSSLSVMAGVAVLILGHGFIEGLDENVIRAQEDALSGHVLLQPEGYPEDGMTLPLDASRPIDAELQARLADERVETWAPRLWSFARLVSGSDSLRAKVLAYDPERDPAVFSREDWSVDGAWPAPQGEVALGSGLARILDIQVGEIVSLELRTRAGAINALQMNVSGLVSARNGALDNIAVWIPFSAADDLLRSEGARSHVAVRLERGRRGAEEAKGWLPPAGWRAQTATEAVADILAINNFRRTAISLIVSILMLIAFTGIASTVVMATYERVREIGTLRAMGMGPWAIRGLFLLEGLAMGSVAASVGALIGGALVAWYAKEGIDLTSLDSATANSEISFNTILYLSFSWERVLRALAFGGAVAVVASIYPAHRAATLNPADAVRAE